MSMLVAAFIGLCLYGMIRILNLASPSLPPNIYAKTRNSEFVQAILSSCPILREPYVPPLLWGKSGHLQTVVYAKVGRMRDPVPSGVRHSKTLEDGSTLTFDLFEPTVRHECEGEYCLLVCPGFGSSSESAYIRALTHHAQARGYHVAVLNHLGSLFNVRLTAPRIFSYGGWEEFHIMRQEVETLYPQCKLLLVGLSMGANIVLKYLGERWQHQEGVWGAISVCQGYNINEWVNEAKRHLVKWDSMRRAYLHIMTANQRRLIRHHGDVLLADNIRRKFNFDPKKIFSATTLEELDRHYTCKLQGYQDVVAYYETNSCSNFLTSIQIPLVMLNAEDDPIVPPPLLRYARDYAENNDNAVFITTKHGGHLAYFESGYIRPQSTSWLDRCICQIADAVVNFQTQGGVKRSSNLLPDDDGEVQPLVGLDHQEPDLLHAVAPPHSEDEDKVAETNILQAAGKVKDTSSSQDDTQQPDCWSGKAACLSESDTATQSQAGGFSLEAVQQSPDQPAVQTSGSSARKVLQASGGQSRAEQGGRWSMECVFRSRSQTPRSGSSSTEAFPSHRAPSLHQATAHVATETRAPSTAEAIGSEAELSPCFLTSSVEAEVVRGLTSAIGRMINRAVERAMARGAESEVSSDDTDRLDEAFSSERDLDAIVNRMEVDDDNNPTTITSWDVHCSGAAGVDGDVAGDGGVADARGGVVGDVAACGGDAEKNTSLSVDAAAAVETVAGILSEGEVDVELLHGLSEQQDTVTTLGQ